MSEYSWDDADIKKFCARCHWRDKDPDLCHLVEPPIKKPFIPKNQDCGFIPESYWQRATKERRDALNESVAERSKKYYSKKK